MQTYQTYLVYSHIENWKVIFKMSSLVRRPILQLQKYKEENTEGCRKETWYFFCSDGRLLPQIPWALMGSANAYGWIDWGHDVAFSRNWGSLLQIIKVTVLCSTYLLNVLRLRTLVTIRKWKHTRKWKMATLKCHWRWLY